MLDTRETPVFKAVERSISADPAALSFKAAGESKEVKVTASGDYSVVSIPAGFHGSRYRWLSDGHRRCEQ